MEIRTYLTSRLQLHGAAAQGIIAGDLDHAQIAIIATIPLGFRVPVVRWIWP